MMSSELKEVSSYWDLVWINAAHDTSVKIRRTVFREWHWLKRCCLETRASMTKKLSVNLCIVPQRIFLNEIYWIIKREHSVHRERESARTHNATHLIQMLLIWSLLRTHDRNRWQFSGVKVHITVYCSVIITYCIQHTLAVTNMKKLRTWSVEQMLNTFSSNMMCYVLRLAIYSTVG